MSDVTAITDDKPSAGSGARVSRSTGRACVQLPGDGTLEARPHDGDRPPPISGRLAADRIIGSGIFEAIAADMTRIDREIKASATPRPPFEEVLAKSGATFIAMRGWGL